MKILSAVCITAVVASGLVNLACYAAQSVNSAVPMVTMAELHAPQAKVKIAGPVGGDLIGELITAKGW